MIGLGTIINTAAIIIGGIFGVIFGKKISQRFRDILISGVGICVIFIGIAGTLGEMFKVVDGTVETVGTMMMIGCFSIGAIIGEFLNIDSRMEQFGEWLKKKTKSEKDSAFVDGFVTASLTVCIGAMAVVGAIKDGIEGDYSVLTAKAVLDLIIVLIMAASMGKGCIFSAIPVFIFQGSITLLARLIAPIMTDLALSYLSLTGSMLIFCVGINLIFGKKIKVANLLPCVFIAVIWAAVEKLIAGM